MLRFRAELSLELAIIYVTVIDTVYPQNFVVSCIKEVILDTLITEGLCTKIRNLGAFK